MTSTTARRRTVHHRPHPPHPPPGRPLRAVLDLGAVPTAPGCARAWTRQILWEWLLAGLSDTVEVIARLPVPGYPEIEAATADTVMATWGGIEVEWHYRPLDGQPADPDQVTAALLAHLGILGVIPEAHP